MEESCFSTYFKVKKIRGRNEMDIYKNYIKDLPEERISKFFEINFANSKLCSKDDSMSSRLRQSGNIYNKQGNFMDALNVLTKSLCCASYNGEAYAFALANRSQNYLELGDFENCIFDIDLCLKAKYPDVIKPTLWIRKAECLKNLGRGTEMKTALLDVLVLIDRMKDLPFEIAEKYKKSVMSMLKGPSVSTINCESSIDHGFNKVPKVSANPTFLNASESIELRYTKRLGKHVIATKEITKGEVLFVERAYAFAPIYNQDGFMAMCTNYCQYCLLELDNCVPCKKCTAFVFCNEKCRDAAWNEYHRWECLAVQANLFKYIKKAHLALRIIIKAAHKGLNRVPTASECDINIFGDKTNNYPYVYNNCTSNISRLPQNVLMQIAGIAAMLVNYLKLKTDFFKWLVKQPGCGEKDDTVLMNDVGALIMRHCSQLPCTFLVVKSYDSNTLINEECLPVSTDIASTVCPSVTTMRHSCVPNTSQYFVGDTIVIKALTDITPNQEIYMAYLEINYITMNTQDRQESLEKNCSLKCKCVACLDPTLDLVAFDSIKCIKCGGRAPPVYANKNLGRIDCSCRHCNHRFIIPSEVLQQIESYNKSWSDYERTSDIEHLKKCLDICKNVYPVTHKVFNMIYWQLLKCYVMKGNLSDAVRIGVCLREFAHIRVIYNTAFECGIQSYLMCKIILEQTNHSLPYVMDLQELGEIIADVSSFLDEAKLIFEIHYPPSVIHILKLQQLLDMLTSIYSQRMDGHT